MLALSNMEAFIWKRGSMFKRKYNSKLIHKLIAIILTLLFVTLLSFLLMRLSPIDPATAYVKRNSAIATPEQIEQARVLLGLDKPLYQQYIRWVGNAVTGEFGISLGTGHPVLYEMLKAVPITLCVVGFAAIIMTIGIFLVGSILYLAKNNFIAKIVSCGNIIGISIPAFYLGILFLNVFAVKFGFISVTGNKGFMKYFPAALCLSVSGICFYSEMLVGSLKREMNEDYANFFRYQGLPEGYILIRHALPHAMIDFIPSFAQTLGLCLAGAAIVERVFSLPGLGYLIIDSVIKRDAPLIHATVLFLALMLVILDIFADLLQSLLQKNKYIKGEIR